MKVVIIILKIESGLEAKLKNVEEKILLTYKFKMLHSEKRSRKDEGVFRRNEGEPKRSELKIQN